VASPATDRSIEASELRVQGLLHLIRQTHVEHDARIAMSNAIRQAEVVVIGPSDHELASRIAQRIKLCGGKLAMVIGANTRFAVRSERATVVDVDAASARGVAVIDESELDRMIEVFAMHTGKEQVRAAARRAVDANRIAATARPTAITLPAPTPGRRMATSREDARRRLAAAPVGASSEDEQELERHARNVRGLNASTPFRHQRQPLVSG
jgi:hypothetical protein